MNNFRFIPIQLHEGLFTGENHISDEIQVLRVGTFFHDGQEIQITKQDLKNMVKNFSENVRGIDLMLDYSHESEKEAAAWFKEVYLSEDGKELWARVDWTDDGAEAVRRKKYRYISADFNFSYKDNETMKNHGPTLLGAGLTNRPVVKKMKATILSEENNYSEQKDDKMNFEEKFKEELEKNKKLQAKLEELEGKMKDSKFSEKEKELEEREKNVKLAEEKQEQEKKDAEKKAEFDKMLSEGQAVEAQREAFMKDNMKEFIANAGKAGDVNFSEKGNEKAGTETNTKGQEFKDSETPAQDEVISLSEKKMKEDSSLDYDLAQDLVLSENSELRARYEKEVEI